MKLRLFLFLNFIFLFISYTLKSNPRPTFLGYNIIHFPSTKQLEKDTLNVNINHRFGTGKEGTKKLFGLDSGANTQFIGNYGVSDLLSVGIGRSGRNQTLEGFAKFKIISQEKFPFQLNYFGVIGRETEKQTFRFSPLIQNPPSSGNSILDLKIQELNAYEKTLSGPEKQSYLNSILLSKRMNDFFSFQAGIIYVHKNYTKSQIGNSRTGVSLGGRLHLSKHIDLSFESIFTPKRDYIGTTYAAEDIKTTYTGINQFSSEEINQKLNSSGTSSIELLDVYIRNIYLDKKVDYKFIPFSLSLDIETGGHVFQIVVSNNQSLAYTSLLRGAEYDYFNKDFIFGFNLSRLFSFSNKNSNFSNPINSSIEEEFK